MQSNCSGKGKLSQGQRGGRTRALFSKRVGRSKGKFEAPKDCRKELWAGVESSYRNGWVAEGRLRKKPDHLRTLTKRFFETFKCLA